MSVDISVSITEDIVDIIATPTVNIVNVTNSASIDPSLYDLSEFTNTSPNPFVRTSGLSSYVPTSRTLTINGLAQDLSTDRSWTISTGLTVGTTPIASGTIGRVLFEGTGNVLQQSSSLFFDSVKESLGLGTSDVATPLGANRGLVINGGTADVHLRLQNNNSGTTANDGALLGYSFGEIYLYNLEVGPLIFGTSNTQRMRIQGNGNVLINTTTDAGFRLDVNGTARVQGNLTTNSATSGILIRDLTSINTYRAFYKSSETPSDTNYLMAFDTDVILNSRGSGTDIRFQGGIRARFGNAFSLRVIGTGTTTATVGFEATNSSSTPLFQVRDNGAVLINTTTDAGFRLDVNGTARVSGNFTAPLVFAGANATTIIYSDDGAASQNGISLIRSNRTGVGNQAIVNFIYQTTEVARFTTSGILAINTTTPNASSIVDITSTTRGFLPPRQTQAQRTAIASPAVGLQVYQTDGVEGLYIYKSTGWALLL
jgi:hypothetical protein